MTPLAFLFILLANLAAGPPPHEPPEGMVWIPGGVFRVGSESARAQPEESPVHRARVDGFFMDRHEVTNDEFAAFAAERCVVSGVPVELAKVENVEFFESLRNAQLIKYCEDFGLETGSKKEMARELFATLFPEKA